MVNCQLDPQFSLLNFSKISIIVLNSRSIQGSSSSNQQILILVLEQVAKSHLTLVLLFIYLIFQAHNKQTQLASCWQRPQVRPNRRQQAGIQHTTGFEPWTLLRPRVLEGASPVSHHPRGTLVLLLTYQTGYMPNTGSYVYIRVYDQSWFLTSPVPILGLDMWLV